MIEILKCPFKGSGFRTKAKVLIKGLLEKHHGESPQNELHHFTWSSWGRRNRQVGHIGIGVLGLVPPGPSIIYLVMS